MKLDCLAMLYVLVLSFAGMTFTASHALVNGVWLFVVLWLALLPIFVLCIHHFVQELRK